MKNWKVKYIHLEDMAMRRPFFKRTAIAAADTRAEAIAKVKAMFSEPIYGRFSASPTDLPPDYHFA